MYRKILAAVDGSESSRNAFRQACRIAREEKSWLTVLTVVPSFSDKFDARMIREEVDKALRAQGEKILASMKDISESEGVAVQQEIDSGSAYEAIIRRSESNGYDLLVMGRRGLRRMERSLMGGTTARVLAGTKKNVLVVPRDTSIGWEKLLLPTDGSSCSAAAAKLAVELAGLHGSKLAVVTVVDVTEEFQTVAPKAMERLVEKAKEVLEDAAREAGAAGVNAGTFLKEGEAFKAITGLAGELGSDLIVMGSHGRTGIGRLIMGSVTEKVIGHAPCPVLVART